MGPKNKRTASTDDNDDQDALAVRIIDLLRDDQILDIFRKALYPEALSAKIDDLYGVIDRLSKSIEAKDDKIKTLENKVDSMEREIDNLEQYTRRPNLRISGIPDTGEGEDTTEKVLAVINGKLGLAHPLLPQHVERSHRVGRQVDRQHPRPVIVRFTSERTRDIVYRAKTALKDFNKQHRDTQIYINDDLTNRRAKMAFESRTLKKNKKIADCWTSYGKVMIKDLTNKVKEVKSLGDLLNI